MPLEITHPVTSAHVGFRGPVQGVSLLRAERAAADVLRELADAEGWLDRAAGPTRKDASTGP